VTGSEEGSEGYVPGSLVGRGRSSFQVNIRERTGAGKGKIGFEVGFRRERWVLQTGDISEECNAQHSLMVSIFSLLAFLPALHEVLPNALYQHSQ